MEEYKWQNVDVFILGQKVDTKAMKFPAGRPSTDKFEYYLHRKGKYYFRNKYRKLVVEKDLNLKVSYGTEFDINFELSQEHSYTVLLNDMDDEISKMIL